jgi:dual specificity phosphatase 3
MTPHSEGHDSGTEPDLYRLLRRRHAARRVPGRGGTPTIDSSTDRAMGRTGAIDGADAHFVADRLAVGAALGARSPEATGEQLDAWRSAGITHVVDCRAGRSDADVLATRAPEIHHLHVGIHDDGRLQPDWFFDDGVGFVLDALADPGARVLVHCRMGINRAPSLAYAVLLARGADPVDGLSQIRNGRPVARIAYAYDALTWHRRRGAVDVDTVCRELDRIAVWMAAHRRNWSLDLGPGARVGDPEEPGEWQ